MAKTLIDEYLEEHEKYVSEYGDRTVIFMMAGSFYEVYGTETEGPNIDFISKKTNYVKTCRNKKIKQISRKNPVLLGFPSSVLEKTIKQMISSSYTVVVIDQITPPPNPQRGVTGIYSPGTYIDDIDPDSINILSIYIENEMSVGMASIDPTTGSSIVYEAHSPKLDLKYALDEAYRFILAQNPKEIILIKNKDREFDVEKIKTHLEISSKKIYVKEAEKTQFKISYQNEFFSKIYGQEIGGMVSTIEYMDMEMMYNARISLIHLLNFVHNHNENFTKNISLPKVFENEKHLILGNNAIHQLNIIDSGSLDVGNSKFTSLFNIINRTSTSLGKRFLKNAIINPLTDPKEINNRYNATEDFLNGSIDLKLVSNIFKNIVDVEKLSRKLALNRIHPYEFSNLVKSCMAVLDLKGIVADIPSIKKFAPCPNVFTKLQKFISEVSKTFDFEELEKQNLKNIQGSFFVEGIYPKIDSLHKKVVNIGVYMDRLKDKLCEMVECSATSKKPIELNRNNKEGYYLSLTKIRGTALQKTLSKVTKVQIDSKTTIQVDDLEFRELKKGKTKIFYTGLGETSGDLVILKDRLIKLVKKTYLACLNEYTEKYSDTFREISKFISVIDFIKSNAIVAKKYGYSKPIIKPNKTKGFLKVKKLRHPIAERLRSDVEYVPHDLSLGTKELGGMLLFGLNSAGKSTLQKAIGMCIIMAQAGLYVPAASLVFSPYRSLLARITGNDNIFKGLSQYTLELTELDAILKRNGPKTLVIGDEVCRGTEHKSGNIIVASTVCMLAEFKCSFIFATHLHEIVHIPSIKNLENVKTFHLTVETDPSSDNLIFDRLLKPGSGPDMYGLTFAKHVIKNDRFAKITSKIKREFSGETEDILPVKNSKYNSDLYIDACQVCGKRNNVNEPYTGFLDVHHINFQSKCTEQGFVIGKSHLKMNEKYNLAVLCKKCHHMVHHHELEITGYKDTAKGRQLQYKFIKPKCKMTFVFIED